MYAFILKPLVVNSYLAGIHAEIQEFVITQCIFSDHSINLSIEILNKLYCGFGTHLMFVYDWVDMSLPFNLPGARVPG